MNEVLNKALKDLLNKAKRNISAIPAMISQSAKTGQSIATNLKVTNALKAITPQPKSELSQAGTPEWFAKEPAKYAAAKAGTIPSTKVQLPFTSTKVTLPTGPVPGFIKYAAELPEKVYNTVRDISSIAKTGETAKRDTLHQVDTFADAYKNTYSQARSLGFTEGQSKGVAALMGMGEGILTLAAAGDEVNGMLSGVYKLFGSDPAKLLAWQKLGYPKTGEELTKNFNQSAYKYHPDRPGGDATKFIEVNKDYQLLKDTKVFQGSGGLPRAATQNPLLTNLGDAAARILGPVSQLGAITPQPMGYGMENAKQLTQTAGQTVPFATPQTVTPSISSQFLRPQVGLSVKEVGNQPDINKVAGKEIIPVTKPMVKIIDFETYATQKGLSSFDIGESALAKRSSKMSDAQWNRIIEAQKTKDALLFQKRIDLKKEYDNKVANGEIVTPTINQEIARSALGHPDNESTQAAKRVLEKQNQYKLSQPTPLATEALKYNSAEDFVNKKLPNKPVKTTTDNYGDTKTFKVLETSWNNKEASVVMPKGSKVFRGGEEGVYYSADLGTAEGYAEGGAVNSVDISGKKLANFQNFTDGKYASDPSVDLKAILKKALNEGYDGLYTRGNYGEVILPTKSQLTDIWNNAHEGQVNQPTQPIQPVQSAETKIGGVAKGIEAKAIKQGLDKGVERGYITSAKNAIPELKLSGQYIPRDTDTLAIKAKNLIKTDIKTAERIVATKTDDQSVAIASELIKHYGDMATKAVDETVKDALYQKAAEVANKTAHSLTEQGRAIQAASILGKLTPEGQVRFAASEIQKYNSEIDTTKGGIFGLRKKIPELTAEQSKDIVTEMKAMEQLPNGEEKAIRFQTLQNSIKDLIPSPLIDKVISVWKAGLLTGIKTSGLNIFSNTSHFVSEGIKNIPAKVVDSVISLFTKKQTIGLTIKGLSGIKEGFIKGTRYLKTGFDERDIGTKLDWNRVNFGKGKIAKGLQAYEETVFRVMGAEDQPFYYGAKAMSLYDQAIAQANTQGLKGTERNDFINNLVENPTDEMVRYSVLDAEIAVYQNPTQLGKIARSIQKTKIGEFVIPFGKTPSAVATQIINYSPIGIVKTIASNIGKGKFDQRTFSQGMGRAITGIAALWLGTLLYKKGKITLSYPTTEKEQKLWEIEGRKENSIKIGNTYRSVSALGPMGNLLTVGGYFQKAYDETGSPTGAMMTSAVGMVKSFSEQTFLQGVNQIIDALNDPARSAEGYFGSTLSSVIPTISGDIARATDPTERRSETILQRMQAKIPFFRNKLEPKITVLGQELPTQGNPLEIMIDPTRPTTDISTPLVVELRRLYNEGYKVTPSLLGDKKGYKGLTQQQNTEIWKRAGQITDSKLTALIELDTYKKLSDEDKGKIIDTFVSKSQVSARVSMVIELTQGLQGEELKKELSKLKASGLMTKEIFNKFLELQ